MKPARFAVVLAMLFSLSAPGPAAASDGPDHGGKAWQDDESVAFAEARAAGRHLVVVFGADWCQPCEKISQIMNDDIVYGLLSKSFVPLYLDVTDLSDSDEALQAKYHVFGLPAVIFVDTKGKELGRWAQNLSAGGLIGAMRAILVEHPLASSASQ